MDIILREDVKGLGYKNDIVKVKAGYGRNKHIPRGDAILANKTNIKMINPIRITNIKPTNFSKFILIFYPKSQLFYSLFLICEQSYL